MKEKPLGSLGYQLARFSLPAVVLLGLLPAACSGPPPEKYSEPPDSPDIKPTPNLVIPLPINKIPSPPVTASETTKPSQPTLEQQAQEVVLDRWFTRLMEEQNDNRTLLSSVLTINDKDNFTTLDIVDKKIPLETTLTVNWYYTKDDSSTPNGIAKLLVSGEAQVKNIITSITQSATLSNADRANGLEWRGEARIEYIYRYRANLKMSTTDRSLPSANPKDLGTFSAWQDEYRIGLLEKRDGTWIIIGSTPEIIYPLNIMQSDLLRSMYGDCLTIQRSCLLPPPNTISLPAPEYPRSNIAISP